MQRTPEIRGYGLGAIAAKAAFTSQMRVAGAGPSLQDFMDMQYQDSQIMDKRPGIYLKYLPTLYDQVNGQLLSGGAYLFDTKKDAEAYDRWTSDEFEVGEPKARFWSSPIFEHAAHWTWDVIGAHNFQPVSEHAVGRLQRWHYQAEDAESVLKEAYPALRAAAEAQGAAAFWLLHHPQQRMIGIQLAFAWKGEVGTDGATQNLKSVTRLPSLTQSMASGIILEPLYDRTSLFLTLWLPLSRAAGGDDFTVPCFPLVPFPSLRST